MDGQEAGFTERVRAVPRWWLPGIGAGLVIVALDRRARNRHDARARR